MTNKIQENSFFINIFKKNITKNIISTVMLFFTFTNTIFAATIWIETSIPSWNYEKILKVEIKTTDPKAKIFYSFNPNGTPNDFLAYTWAIFIKKSTPLIYWWFIDTQNETKIMQNDYNIYYTNNIRLWTWVILENWLVKNAILTNIGTGLVDISFWEVKKDYLKISIPENTVLEPWKNYELSFLTWTWIISLYSPDEEKKDFVEIQEVKKIENPINSIKQDNLKPDYNHYFSNNTSWNNSPKKSISNTEKPQIEEKNNIINPENSWDSQWEKTSIPEKQENTTPEEKPKTEEIKNNNWEVTPETSTISTKDWVNNDNWIIESQDKKDTSITDNLKIDIKNTQGNNSTWIYIVFGIITIIILGWIIRILIASRK